MRFSAPKKFVPEDYPTEFRTIAAKLFQDLNQFMQQVASALTQGLVIVDNFKAIKVDLNIAIGQAYPMTQNVSALKDRPSSVYIGQIYPIDQSTPTQNVTIWWTYDSGTLSYRIIGLDTAKAYKGNLIVLV